MYIKLNYNDNVQWKDVFNTLRIVLKNNVTGISDLTTFGTAIYTDYTTNIDVSTRNLLDTTNSEIYRNTAPGVGYTTGTNSPWSWNWSESTTGTVTYAANFQVGPEIVIQRSLSTNSDKKYYIRLRHDGTNFTMGCFSTGPSDFSTSNGANKSTNLLNGEDRIVGYNMSSLTSFFCYITPTSIIVSGKGPTTSTGFSTTGWLTTASRPVTTTPGTGATSTYANISSIAPDGSRISFSSISTGTEISTTAGTYYYLRTLGNGNSYSISSNLYNLHTGTYISRTASQTVTMNIDGYLPHNPNASNSTAAHFGPAFISEYTPYDATAIGTNNYIPVMYTGGYTFHSTSGAGSPKSWYGISAQDFLWAEPYHTSQGYKLLSIQYPTPTTNNTWAVSQYVPCYIGNDFRTIERAPLGDANYGYITVSGTISGSTLTFTSPNLSNSFGSTPVTTSGAWNGWSISANVSLNLPTGLYITGGSGTSWTLNASVGTYTGIFYITRPQDVPLTPALSDQPAYKFSDSSTNGSYGLFPLVWSLSQYNTAGGKLNPALAGFMLYNGEYYPDDYFTTGGTTYALWPLADGFTRRLGIAVPKS